MRWGHWDFSLLAGLDECQDCEARELCDSFIIGFSALRARKLTVLNSQGTSPDLLDAGQGWDALGQQGGAAVDQPPLTIEPQQIPELGASGTPKTCVRVCVRGGGSEGESVRVRVGACACVRVGGGRGRDTPIRREVGKEEVLGRF